MADQVTPRWASVRQVSKYLDLHARTITRLTKAGIITAHKLGTSVRYDLNEIDAVLKASAQPAVSYDQDEIDAAAADILASARTTVGGSDQ